MIKKLDLIVDIGSNWRVGTDKESRARASKLITAALNSGATTVKFQLFRADKLYREDKLQKQIMRYELPLEWLPELKQETEEQGGQFLVTPFYLDAVDELMRIGVNRFKIASWDMTYDPLLRLIAQTGKPVIMSTGAATMEEVDHAIGVVRPDNLDGLTIMHCTGGYPTILEEIVLRRIIDLAQEFFPVEVGFSAHVTEPYIVAAAALFMVETFEVHFDLADNKGTEQGHSYSPEYLVVLRRMIEEIYKARECECAETFGDFNARLNYRRDPSDWLRPPLKEEPLR